MRGLPGRKKSGRRKGVSLWCCIRRLQNGDIPPSALNGEKTAGAAPGRAAPAGFGRTGHSTLMM